MKLRLLSIFFAVSLFLLIGALGLKTPDECESTITHYRTSEMMSCLHTAAISIAYLGDADGAIDTCRNIWVDYGSSLPAGDDTRRKAELVTNSCFYEVAKVARDPELCEWISNYDDVSDSGINGPAATGALCKHEVCRLTCINTENYYRSGGSTGGSSACPSNTCESTSENLCALIFLLPFLVCGIIYFKEYQHP
ncbi:hypothetical protein KKF81_03835 [Candidatus Micrarchaeota archaeon]|nr:hypothetical protein [Candidatus Micrarchaeota archaeon]MBU1166056.1 hypothetical protein [Candidatus Micrarchaeota archaeon]MBU1886881.1 hypothetical protein [Candidatus Micrarchaeota archaeon]